MAGPPPNISVQPANQTVLKGGTASFVVVASSTTTLNYQWNYKLLMLNVPIPGATNNVLTIKNASGFNVGTYNVAIVNANGTKMSKDASLTVIPTTPPVVNDDAFSTPQNVLLSIGINGSNIYNNNNTENHANSVASATVISSASVLSNDSAASGNALTAVLVTNVLHGTLNFNGDGSFQYQPDTNFCGVDGFSYVANDGSDTSAPAKVTITVTASSNSYSPPSVTLLPATSVTAATANLNATINSGGLAASYYFQFGTTTNYGLVTPMTFLENGTSDVPVASSVIGLIHGTDYHYCIIVTGPGGTSVSGDLVFTTSLNDVTVLNLTANGPGGSTPALDGALLNVGQTYGVTATPAATGVSFMGWKDGSGNLLTTNSLLTFVMSSNLVFSCNFADVSRPVLSITNLVSGCIVSNGVFVVKGTARDNLSVANVLYSLNNSGWTAADNANDWSNWSATLLLNSGINTLSLCALDASGNYFITNNLMLNYVPVSTLSVRTTGMGTVSPLLNGAVLRIGQSYTLAAMPAAGFAFANWKDGNGLVITNKAALTFAMVSNLTVTASFVDIIRPTLTTVAPMTTTSTTNEFFQASGRAVDNVGIASVQCRLNDGDWYAAAPSNSWTNWLTILDLTPGTNVFSAFATDADGNSSTTNSVRFVYTTAPALLTGLKAVLTPAALEIAPLEMAFAANTFSQIARDTNNSNSVGSYVYAKLTPATATLKLNFTAPPRSTNAGGQILLLRFISPVLASYSNSVSGKSGVIQFSPATSLTAAALASQSLVFVGNDGREKINAYAAVTYVSLDVTGRATNRAASYTYAVYSPLAALLKENGTNGMTYTMASFAGTNFGTAYSESYNSTGGFIGRGLGFFGLMSQSKNGNAPTNFSSRNLTFDSVGSRFKVSFATNTFAQFSLSEAVDSGVGSYLLTGFNTNMVDLALAYSSPNAISGSVGNVRLQFIAQNIAVYTNADGTAGNAVLRNSAAVAPSTLAGVVINTTNSAGNNWNQFGFNLDNTFSITGYLNVTGSYSFATSSLDGGMVQLAFTGGSLAGDTGSLQLDYATASAGRYMLSVFDSTNTLVGTSRGFFGQQ